MVVGPTAVGYPSQWPALPTPDKPVAPSASGTESSSPSVFYPTPIYQVDPLAKITVVEFRNPSTGDVTNQIPSAKVVEQYRKQREAGIAAIPGEQATSAPGAATKNQATGGQGAAGQTAASPSATGQTTGGTGASWTTSASTGAAATTPAVAASVVPVATVAAASASSSAAAGRVSIHA